MLPQSGQQPQWQSFTQEVQGQFPDIAEDDLTLLTQRTIEANESPEPAATAALQAVTLHARWQSDYAAHLVYDHPPEEALRKVQPQIDAQLAKWRGETVEPATLGTSNEPEPVQGVR